MWIPGKGMGVLQNFQKFRVRVWKCYRTHRSSVYCGTGIQNSQKFRAGTKNAVPVPRVLLHGAYRTHRTSEYGFECPTELTEVLGTGMNVLQNLDKFRVLWHWRTERTDVPGTGINVVHNSQKFLVQVWMSYRTHRSSGYR